MEGAIIQIIAIIIIIMSIVFRRNNKEYIKNVKKMGITTLIVIAIIVLALSVLEWLKI